MRQAIAVFTLPPEVALISSFLPQMTEILFFNAVVDKPNQISFKSDLGHFLYMVLNLIYLWSWTTLLLSERSGTVFFSISPLCSYCVISSQSDMNQHRGTEAHGDMRKSQVCETFTVLWGFYSNQVDWSISSFWGKCTSDVIVQTFLTFQSDLCTCGILRLQPCPWWSWKHVRNVNNQHIKRGSFY